MYLLLNFSMSRIFLEIQLLNRCRKFCLWALMIAINVSVVICQLPIYQFSALEKRTITRIIVFHFLE